jgi:hypothetical protein
VHDVLEVSLRGAVSLEASEERLAREGLFPSCENGRAEAVLLGAEARFMGKRFREVSLSLAVSHASDGSGRDGAYLIAAFNDVRFFAWVERRLFRTPYAHGRVVLAGGDRPSIEAGPRRGVPVVRVQMGGDARSQRTGDEAWEGPIYLPRRAGEEYGQHFFGRLTGPSVEWPFDGASDTFVLAPRGDEDPFGLLERWAFQPLRWQLRAGSVHARSKTYRRC